MTRRTLAIAGLAVALLAGCGDDDGAGSGDKSADAMKKEDAAMKKEDEAMKKEDEAMKEDDAMAAGAVTKVVDSQFGPILADKKGQAVYLFDKESSPRSECYGGCADAWPPFLTKGKPTAGSGAQKDLLGTTKRKDGKLQVTYAGHPLYYYVDDGPGKVLCHNVDEFGGRWLVVHESATRRRSSGARGR